MSYILDALRKAEAERTAESHGRLPIPPGFDAPRPREPRDWDRPWVWAGASALVTALVAAAWLWPSHSPTPPRADAPRMAAVQPPAIAPAPAPAIPPQPTAPVQDKPAERAADEPPPGKTKREGEAQKKPAPKKSQAASAEARERKKPQTPPDTAEREEAVVARSELPPQVQQEMPQLMISGYLYSKNRADRSVLINNRLLREGEEIAPGFVLEKMMPTGMVLNYKGHRYRTGY